MTLQIRAITDRATIGLCDVALTPKGNPRSILGRSEKAAAGEAIGVLTAIVYLAPSTSSGFNLCPFATEGCSLACLGHSSGRMTQSHVQQCAVDKARWLRLYQPHFLAQLDVELAGHALKAERLGMRAAVRLNGSSDVLWERLLDMRRHPSIQFYDYTKVPLERRLGLPSNYHLTFSLSEAPESMDRALQYLESGHNAAVVFRTPEQRDRAVETGWEGFPVHNADLTDCRFLDPAGSWAGLYAKGAIARRDASGFVRDYVEPRSARDKVAGQALALDAVTRCYPDHMLAG